MDNSSEYIHREIIERYCSIIDGNTAIVQKSRGDDVSYECLEKPRCEKNFGGCKNKKYGKQ